MHKTILKLTAAGLMITTLLSVTVISQGCDNTDSKTPAAQGTQTTAPGYYLPLDPEGTGGRCDETLPEVTSSETQQSQTSTQQETDAKETGFEAEFSTGTRKPTIGQAVQNFFEDLFGGSEDEPKSTVATTSPKVEKPKPAQQPTAGAADQQEMRIENMDYKTFKDLSSEDKMAFRKLFIDNEGNVDDEAFIIWYNRVKKEYEDEKAANAATGPTFAIG